MPNKIQNLIVEIERADKVRKTMMKRLRKHGEVLNKAKKYLKETGIRPYHKRTTEPKRPTPVRRTPQKSVEMHI